MPGLVWLCVAMCWVLQVETYELSERALVQAVRSLKESFTETKHDSQHEVAHLSSERVRLTQQVSETLSSSCLD